MGITRVQAFSGLEDQGQTGWGATYNRTGITSATTRTRGADGAWETVDSIFARSTSRARGTLKGEDGWRKPVRNHRTTPTMVEMPTAPPSMA